MGLKLKIMKFNDIVHKFNRVKNTSKYVFVHKIPNIVFVFSTSTTFLTNALVKLAMHLSHCCNYLFSFDLYFFPTANEYSFFWEMMVYSQSGDMLQNLWRLLRGRGCYQSPLLFFFPFFIFSLFSAPTWITEIKFNILFLKTKQKYFLTNLCKIQFCASYNIFVKIWYF